MTYLPREIQFKPMDYLYEQGKNPWGLLKLKTKTAIICGSKEEYNRIISKCKLPVELAKHIIENDIKKIVMKEFPENFASSIDIVDVNDKSEIDYEYTYDI